MKSKIKVLAIFRIPVSYFNPLLERFAKEETIKLRVAFCVKPPDDKIYPKNLNYIFLSNAEKAYINNKHSERDQYIYQPDIKGYIRKWQPDVIFLASGYLPPTSWMAIAEAKKFNIPIITRMTSEVARKRNILKRIVKKVVVGSYCKAMSAGVFECKSQQQYMLQYGMKIEQLFFSPCSVDNDYFRDLYHHLNREEVREELGISNDEFAVVCTAELIIRKRPMDIIKAVEKLKSKGIKIRLYFIGDGELKKDIRQYKELRNLSEVNLCGYLSHENMAKYLTAADVFVLVSENDASPKALNEAMNFGLPIIITKGIETSREMCVWGENGYVIDPGDVDGLAKYIEIIAGDKNNRDIMGNRSIEIVNEFCYDNAIKGWMEAVQYCVNEK